MKGKSENHPLKCSSPTAAAVLADYWIAELAAREEEAVEEHLLECDSCGERLREMIALAEGIRELAREGSLRMVVSDAFLKSVAAEGRRIREYVVPAGGGVECTVTAEDDFLIGRLAVNLSGVTRVDLCICDDAGVERQRLADIPVHAGVNTINVQESITLAKAAPTATKIFRLLALDESGRERPLGEYTFNHKRSLPGPGEWSDSW